MKTIILNSPLFKNHNPKYDEDSLPPIGLGLIATNLRLNNIEVELIDAVHERIPLSELINILNDYQPDFVATNIFTTNYELVKELVESLSFKTHVIIGGLSTKDLFAKIFTWNSQNKIDIVTGDGELITLDIVNSEIKEKPFRVSNNFRFYQVDGNSIYSVKDISKVQLDRSFFKNEPIDHPLGFSEANIVTSRGCIFNCTFCAAARSQNKNFPIREKSEESIVKELLGIKKMFPQVTSIRVLDDLFLKTNKTVQKAIKVFTGTGLQWRSMAHVSTFSNVDLKSLIALRESGCSELFIGIESGSPKILKSINKTHNITKIKENLSKVLKAGINLKGYFIYGFPNETEADMELTYQLALDLKNAAIQYGSNFRTSVFQYRPYHGTQIYHDLEKKGVELHVTNSQGNVELSSLVGRYQFNFHTGNYSKVRKNRLDHYIYRTINLNDGGIFSRLQPATRKKDTKSL